MKCKLCGFKFWSGTLRIRGHFLKVKGRGVGFCSAEESKLRPAVAELRNLSRRARQSRSMGHRSASWTQQARELKRRSEKEECRNDEETE